MATPQQRGLTIARTINPYYGKFEPNGAPMILINTTAVHTEVPTNNNNTIAVMKTTFYRLQRFYRNTPFQRCTNSNVCPNKFYAPNRACATPRQRVHGSNYDTPQQRVQPRDNGLVKEVIVIPRTSPRQRVN